MFAILFHSDRYARKFHSKLSILNSCGFANARICPHTRGTTIMPHFSTRRHGPSPEKSDFPKQIRRCHDTNVAVFRSPLIRLKQRPYRRDKWFSTCRKSIYTDVGLCEKDCYELSTHHSPPPKQNLEKAAQEPFRRANVFTQQPPKRLS